MCITLMPVPALAVVNIGPTCGETSIQHAIDTYTENLYLNSAFETRYCASSAATSTVPTSS